MICSGQTKPPRDRTSRFRAVALAPLFLLLANTASSARPIDYAGLTLAYPINQPIDFPRFLVDTLVSEQVVAALLTVDSTGCVLGVAPSVPSDSPMVMSYQDYFGRLDFAPGAVDGRAVNQTLPIRLRLQPRVPFPIVLYPRDSTGEIGQPDIYLEALRHSGFQPPSVQTFPWFHCDLKASDTSIVYRYVLLRLALDSLGELVDLQEVRSTYPAYTMPISSAANYADFAPALIAGRPAAATCYLLVSFFAELSYPSLEWTAGDSASAHYLRWLSVRMVPDSQMLLSLPIPRLASQGEFAVNGPVPPVDSLSIRFNIDTLGHASFQRIFPQTGKTTELARVLERQLRFYPALRFDGSPVSYGVIANITVTGPKTIRIRYSWMPPSSI